MTSDGGPLDRATAAAWTREVLAARLDEPLRAEGFTRPAKSIAYTRKIDGGKQRIDFDLVMRPRYARDAVQLTLFTSLLLPEVGAKAAELRGEPFVRGKPDLVQRELLGTLVRNPPVLTFRTPAELAAHVPTIEGYLRTGVLPHLDARRTVRAFAEPKAEVITRLGGNDGQWGAEPVVVAAAFLVLGEPERAKELLATAYPPDSPSRPRYEHVLAAVGC
ncbi:hypothetical protein OG439_27980 [Amycolatopsis sp. NBC_01307]|uniref:hypothetical protein n=1 Tax=Amycolatopsis sp. NBC_01307 TaxID=2903561 RepID=UPI002E14AD80|nr:hypothetical protein OG439_27980 [Amycolatopsis sp. NBC_01307]